MHRLPRWFGALATIVVLGVWALVLRPQSLGGPLSYVVIRGTSMLPAYETGDLVVARAAPSYSVGEIVAYRVPAGMVGAGHLVVHRIVGGDGSAGFVVRGDNNDGVDPWLPRTDDVVGVAWVHVPVLGRLLDMLHQPALLGSLTAAIVAAWIVARAPGGRPMTERRASRGVTGVAYLRRADPGL